MGSRRVTDAAFENGVVPPLLLVERVSLALSSWVRRRANRKMNKARRSLDLAVSLLDNGLLTQGGTWARLLSSIASHAIRIVRQPRMR